MSDRLAYARAVMVWRFGDAPNSLRRLVTKPGSWVVVVPKGVEPPPWCKVGSSPEWGVVERRELTDGDVCLIAFPVDRQAEMPLA